MPRPLDIAILGAGITGLACATLLSRDGHRVVVYERFDTSRPIGSGLMLQPTGLAALQRLGLRETIEALGARIERLHGVTDRGRTIFDLCYGDLDPRYFAIGVHRAALHETLWNAFLGCGARLETGRTGMAVENSAGSKAALRDDKGRISPAFDLVIDASGARSPLRPSVSGNRVSAFTYGAMWASVPDIGISPNMLAQRYVAAQIMIGYLPIGRASENGPLLAALFWSLKPGDYQRWRSNFADWRGHIVSLWPELAPVVENLKSPDDMTFAGYTQFTARAPFKGPVALAGDSAHATSPQLGQGANSGLLDALALRDALTATPDLASALALYARNRRDHVRFYQRASAIMTPFFQSDSRALSIIRDLTFDRMKIVPYLRREMVRTLAGLKTGLFTHSDPAVLAGDGPGTVSAFHDVSNAPHA
jgi:2-polyprenyl-6-methoxyphenol hydroxylase-like FAD-dependent oxidoreductase